jgi:hypothetical protein
VVNQFPSPWRGNIDANSFFRTWRTTLAGVLIGFLAGQAMALTWLAMSPASRNAAAQCVKLASQEAKSNY